MNKYFLIIFISAIGINFKELGFYEKAPFKTSEIIAYQQTGIDYQAGVSYQIAVQKGHSAPIIYRLSITPFTKKNGSMAYGSCVVTPGPIPRGVFLKEKDTDEILEACLLVPTRKDLFESASK